MFKRKVKILEYVLLVTISLKMCAISKMLRLEAAGRVGTLDMKEVTYECNQAPRTSLSEGLFDGTYKFERGGARHSHWEVINYVYVPRL